MTSRCTAGDGAVFPTRTSTCDVQVVIEGDRWPSDWIRAALPMVVLAVLGRGDAHGYALLQTLRELGLGALRGSTLYPLLARQEELGRVEHRYAYDGGGPARKVFVLTARGRDDLQVLRDDWAALTSTLDAALDRTALADVGQDR